MMFRSFLVNQGVESRHARDNVAKGGDRWYGRVDTYVTVTHLVGSTQEIVLL